MARGKYIAFEGGGGTGKDTLIELFKQKVAGREDFVFTRAPGGTPMGERIRELLLSPEAKELHPRAEFLLFLAAHTELIEKVIAPALEEGKNVVSNRSLLSLIAYQSYGREQMNDFMLMQEAIRFVMRGHIPDLCLLLDAPPKLAIARARKRPGEPHRFVTEELEFQERVREGYKKHVGTFAHKSVVIDTSGTTEEAWTKTQEALESFLLKRL
ncbi:dTMP kinase [Candidatus Parcubacteria bacterium]|nr:MAG: dTMP kinase [Candidatus Parcubacteria bacterium]